MKCFGRKGLIVFVAFLFAFCIFSEAVYAEIPRTMSYEGRLSYLGRPASGDYPMNFCIYSSASGGTEFWCEEQTVNVKSGGYFYVLLGHTNPITIPDTYDGTLFLGITVEPLSRQEMTPRIELTNVPYSERSRRSDEADTAKDVPCEDITPRSVTICSVGMVIDPTGKWVGDPTGLVGPEGPQGEVGPQGPIGLTGPQGEVGPQGPIGLTGPQGEVGPKGDTGEIGPQGIQGEIGPKGDTGDIGPIGPQGIQGIQGEIGPQGVQGLTGDTGPQGVQGEIGPKGDTGDTGPIGPQGIQGEIGPMGPEGPEGPEGPMPSYANVITVATSGDGDYTEIYDALDSFTDNSQSNPYLIKVMPGYYLSGFTMKEYVRIQGAGAEQCSIKNTVIGADNATLDGFRLDRPVYCDGKSPTISNCATDGLLVNVTGQIAYLTNGADPVIANNDVTFIGGDAVFVDTNSEPVVINNIFTNLGSSTTCSIHIRGGSGGRYAGNKIVGAGYGIRIFGDATYGRCNPVIADNEIDGAETGIYVDMSEPIITGNTLTTLRKYGIVVRNDSTAVITGNTIRQADASSVPYYGIYLYYNDGLVGGVPTYDADMEIANNVIRGNGTTSQRYGVYSYAPNYPLLVNNIITGHGSGGYDIYVSTSAPKIMFNVFDTINGAGGQGSYNTNSNGAAIAVP